MKNVLKMLKTSKRVGIIAHISPDSDCMSSLTVLEYILKSMGKEVGTFIDLTKPYTNYVQYNFNENITAAIVPENFDLLVGVDLAAERLMGKYINTFKEFSNTLVIDHHANRDLNAKYVYVDANKSSCCEIIFEIAEALKVKLTKQMATYLFMGLVGDTNCFENDNTNESSHFVASKLYALGADTKKVVFDIRKHQKLSDIKFKQLAYSNIVAKNQIGYLIFTLKMQKEVETDHTGDIVNEILNLEDNLFSFVIKQKEKNTYTVSLRCKEGYDVAKVANAFGGGGHTQAAGMNFVGAPIRHAKLIYNECLKQIKTISKS